MKRLKLVLLLSSTIIFFLARCQIFHPGQPRLISPKNDEVFDSLPPNFVWSMEDVNEYYLMVFKDSLWSNDTLLWDTLEDTTFTLSSSDFYSADTGTYVWTVAVDDSSSGGLLYPSPRNFRIKGLPLPPLDLDTTYFPFGLGYEWCYERHVWYYDYNAPDTQWKVEDKYDTFKIIVSDSFWCHDTLFITSGGTKELVSPIKIWNNQIVVGLEGYYCHPIDTIPVACDKDTTFTDIHHGLTSEYKENILIISLGYEPSPGEYCLELVRRSNGIGATNQGFTGSWPSGGNGDVSRLLWFYNGKDTVYDASQSEALRSLPPANFRENSR